MIRDLLQGDPSAYAGIGSRSTPDDVLELMMRLAAWLGGRGWTLRSGGAEGADTAFYTGTGTLWGSSASAAEIFLPWPGFNGLSSPYSTPTLEAHRIAERYHPSWHQLTRGSRALHARNAHQVLGANLRMSSAFVVCWTPDAVDGVERLTSFRTGGTGQAIRIATGYGVPVFNLCNPIVRHEIEDIIR